MNPRQVNYLQTENTDSQVWYPVHPRYLKLLRIVAILFALGAIYIAAQHHTFSVYFLSSIVFPLGVSFYWFSVQPELRSSSFLSRCGILAHWLLLFLVLPLVIFATLARLFYL